MFSQKTQVPDSIPSTHMAHNCKSSSGEGGKGEEGGRERGRRYEGREGEEGKRDRERGREEEREKRMIIWQ